MSHPYSHKMQGGAKASERYGHEVAHRARGGRATKVNINIISPSPGREQASPPPLPPAPPMGAAAPPMSGPLPFQPPGGGAPPMPMRARGGKVPMKAGSLSGEGRLEKIKAYGLKPSRGK